MMYSSTCVPPGQRQRFTYRRTATAQLAALRARPRYLTSSWTRKSCAICGSPVYELHHLDYARDNIDELLLVVPLCRTHHQDFSLNLWPHARGHFTRAHATLLYIVHGGRLHQHWCDDGEQIRVGVSPYQESLL